MQNFTSCKACVIAWILSNDNNMNITYQYHSMKCWRFSKAAQSLKKIMKFYSMINMQNPLH